MFTTGAVPATKVPTITVTPAATQQSISGTTVTGDVIIDLDQNHNPVWLWNAFDHLDVNRQPMGFPDWTHGNAILYSSDDGNLIVSLRHQMAMTECFLLA